MHNDVVQTRRERRQLGGGERGVERRGELFFDRHFDALVDEHHVLRGR
jgi:hypothetical protein